MQLELQQVFPLKIVRNLQKKADSFAFYFVGKLCEGAGHKIYFLSPLIFFRVCKQLFVYPVNVIISEIRFIESHFTLIQNISQDFYQNKFFL